ncbi:membrane protein [Mycobacterium phage Skinny]|uniref:Uncharacterized protein n=6 Tax=Bongovirus bongo TaxID=1983750 RepID=A0A0M3UKD3_9CAUD|nr:hypothetical protein PEGLEG_53 [Mycobacterium phage PegLeg]YP_009604911.1 hypothetical protein FDH95_gp053 [Mycobacterium phage Bongo]ALF00581.1 hypothetical protein SEA_BRICOLE_53 [Mycobacterium phage Bricole]AXQ52694.1 hypothetical protein SEA_IPHANE7_53 [Mycobacterium phage IPhane7]QDH93626.1 hypothetical protein SEA_LILHOMIEP_52 [Mycobacterium phage LilhomieP]QGJ93200.1 hypothetical protein SEA_TYDAWG_53 [Mycobacterium phage TyDawg]QUU29253.1 hypothetical protein [Mycobacterium phage S
MSGISTLLVAAFIILKLVGVDPIAMWSWWAVFSPWLIELGLAIIFGVIYGIVTVITD